MNIKSEMVYDETIVDRIATRYAREIAQLESVGFQKLCIVKEKMTFLNPLYILLIYFYRLIANDPSHIEFPFQLVTYTPLLVCHETACVVMVCSLGVKYYTHFTDSTTLISNNFEAEGFQAPNLHCFKYCEKADLEETHLRHQDRTRSLLKEDRVLDHNIGYEEYLDMSNIELDCLKALRVKDGVYSS